MAITAPPLAGTFSTPVMSKRRPSVLKTTLAKAMTGRYTGSRVRAMPNGSARAVLLRGGGPRGGGDRGGRDCDAHRGVGLAAGPGAGAVGGHRGPGVAAGGLLTAVGEGEKGELLCRAGGAGDGGEKKGHGALREGRRRLRGWRSHVTVV